MAGTMPASGYGIFISYRRDDSAYPAGWLFDLLAGRFGRDRVFKDVDSLQPGDDFAGEITAAVGACAVLLAVIGMSWLTRAREDGRRRLDEPGDLVRGNGVQVYATIRQRWHAVSALSRSLSTGH